MTGHIDQYSEPEFSRKESMIMINASLFGTGREKWSHIRQVIIVLDLKCQKFRREKKAGILSLKS